MMQVNTTLFWGLLELLLLMLVIVLVMIFLAYQAKQKDKQAAKALVTYLKESGDGRKKRLKEVFAGRYGYEGEALKKIVRGVSKRETLFYQHLLKVYLNRSGRQLVKIPMALEDTVSPYLELDLPKAAVAEATESPEFEKLKKENHELSEELRVTMDTMGRMLEEYSGMFAAAGPPSETAPTEPAPMEKPVAAEPEEVDLADEWADLTEEPLATDDDGKEIGAGADLDDFDVLFDEGELADEINPKLLDDK
jgi:hypothetical protein